MLSILLNTYLDKDDTCKKTDLLFPIYLRVNLLNMNCKTIGSTVYNAVTANSEIRKKMAKKQTVHTCALRAEEYHSQQSVCQHQKQVWGQ